ncbi:hypothetical protein AB1Y20_021360 [Prymnesium parvum]|uniref:Uncharacterized protein n=1 Tax=Prymnesium parvum TaxID=97485 RepID=A0AB34JJF7_PRYPA
MAVVLTCAFIAAVRATIPAAQFGWASRTHIRLRPVGLRRSDVVGSAVTEMKFTRASDLLSMGEAVDAKDIVNVLGRWKSYKDWESVGRLVEIDKLFDSSGQPLETLPALTRSGLESIAGKGRVSKGYGDNPYKQDPRPTPQRRGFCLRRGLVQRYWLGENVGLLPFRDTSMAESVGSSVEEMNSSPINPLAVDVVFDALSTAQSGIIQRELCDARRASYVTAGGAFNFESFSNDINTGRRNILIGYCFLPGVPFTLSTLLFIKLDGWSAVVAQMASSNGKMLWDVM